MRVGELMLTLLDSTRRKGQTQIQGLDGDVLEALASLLDGPIDVDRCDYLPRDLMHLGRDPTSVVKAGNVIAKSVAVAPSKGLVFREENDDVGRAIREIWGAREDAYRTVYEAPAKLSYDAMLQHAIFYFLTREAALDEAAASSGELVTAFLALTDDELYHLCYELGGKALHGNTWFLLRGTVACQPFDVGRGYFPVTFQRPKG